MKIKLSSILKTVGFTCAALLCIYGATVVLRDKESEYKYADFFDRADQIDVLFIGSSHVINAINPAVLYGEYGYTSYNMGGHGSVMQATYWELIEALQYTTPKCVVVDTYLMNKDYQYLDQMYEDSDEEDRATSVAQLHLNMDCWPMDKIKVAAVEDLIADKEIRKQFYVPFHVYHNRWEELDSNDYKALTGTADRNPLFGAEMRYGIELTPGIYPDPEDENGLGGHTVGEEYLRKIIDECQRRNIDVMVTFLTCSASTEDKRVMDSAEMICEQYDVPFINMQEMGVVDLYTDLNDTGHMNAMGAIKATKCIGQELSEIDGITDHRGDVAYDYWQQRADEFYGTIYDMAVDSESIYQQLNYLSGAKTVSSIIYINDGSQAFGDNEMQRLLHNFTVTPKIYHTDGPYILINDVASGQFYEACDGEVLDGIKTSLGTVHYQPVEHLFRLFYTDEDPETNLLYDDSKSDYDIQIITYDAASGEILSHNYYKSYGSNYTQE
ncbi:hypothetical protein D6855_12405 [Butyrivibrio sp. CB08]|uniref:hypothetical protein n=1 Tax=Butyrivibrio sp. CB08 TaxID=2364879 RepID=UPI000EA99868|nr:hypothetical protein [Butyrivibrio sp. CB08]RKM57845.1 hypothetical protein D6855_12405 [Butyrivibrio sp. CB08]